MEINLKKELKTIGDRNMNRVANQVRKDIWPVLIHNIDHGVLIVAHELEVDFSKKEENSIRKAIAMNLAMDLFKRFNINVEIK